MEAGRRNQAFPGHGGFTLPYRLQTSAILTLPAYLPAGASRGLLGIHDRIEHGRAGGSYLQFVLYMTQLEFEDKAN